MIRTLISLTSIIALSSTLSFSTRQALAAEDGVQIKELPDRLRVEVNGTLFTEFFFTGKSHPIELTGKEAGSAGKVTHFPKHVYFYPLLGPGGLPMTRNYPMMPDAQGEDKDHLHHRSLWYSHGAVNGIDFWSESAKAGRIVHDKFLEVKSGKESGVIRSANKWVAPGGAVVLTDELTFRVYARPNNERLFDFEVTLKAGEKEVVLGDTKEGTMAIRLNETMRLKHNKMNAGKPNGRIIQSTGVRDGATWGKRAEWCDYSGSVDGKVVGVAIFDHPSNPRFPTWWHVRDYGLFAANPFGIHDFEKKPAGAGDLKIPAGQSLTFKYRFYLHEGDETQGKVAERYKEWSGAK